MGTAEATEGRALGNPTPASQCNPPHPRCSPRPAAPKLICLHVVGPQASPFAGVSSSITTYSLPRLQHSPSCVTLLPPQELTVAPFAYNSMGLSLTQCLLVPGFPYLRIFYGFPDSTPHGFTISVRRVPCSALAIPQWADPHPPPHISCRQTLHTSVSSNLSSHIGCSLTTGPARDLAPPAWCPTCLGTKSFCSLRATLHLSGQLSEENP